MPPKKTQSKKCKKCLKCQLVHLGACPTRDPSPSGPTDQPSSADERPRPSTSTTAADEGRAHAKRKSSSAFEMPTIDQCLARKRAKNAAEGLSEWEDSSDQASTVEVVERKPRLPEYQAPKLPVQQPMAQYQPPMAQYQAPMQPYQQAYQIPMQYPYQMQPCPMPMPNQMPMYPYQPYPVPGQPNQQYGAPIQPEPERKRSERSETPDRSAGESSTPSDGSRLGTLKQAVTFYEEVLNLVRDGESRNSALLQLNKQLTSFRRIQYINELRITWRKRYDELREDWDRKSLETLNAKCKSHLVDTLVEEARRAGKLV